MKKILSPRISGRGPARLAGQLRSLIAGDPEIAGIGGEITVREAWALSGDQVKVRVEVRLPDRSYRLFTRVVMFPLPPELNIPYRDWTIVVTPSWYGFGWRVCDESGIIVGESQDDLYSSEYAQENARHEVDRLITKRVMGKAFPPSATRSTTPKRPSTRSPVPQRVKPVTPASTERSAMPASSQAKPFPTKQPSQKAQFPALPSLPVKPVEAFTIAPVQAERKAMPAILAGYQAHQAPELAGQVANFYSSVGETFEAWVNRCHSPHTRRAYCEDVMAFAAFMGIDWLQSSTRMLTIKITDVLAFRGSMLERGMAPKTINRRLASLSSFYKYLAAAAAEHRLPITIPNPAHAQFVPRGSADPREETKALSVTRARQLMGLPAGDDLVDYRDRAILKLYLYSGIRLTTGCRMKVTDFHQDGTEATIKLHEKGDKWRTIGLHSKAGQAISEYIEEAGITSGPLFRAQAAPRSRKKLSNRPMDPATMYRLIESYLGRLPGAIKKKQLPDGAEIEYCIYTPHSLRATTATLLLGDGVDIKKVKDLLGHRHLTTTQIYDKRRIATSQSASHDVPI